MMNTMVMAIINHTTAANLRKIVNIFYIAYLITYQNQMLPK